jgi:hypothetical protein
MVVLQMCNSSGEGSKKKREVEIRTVWWRPCHEDSEQNSSTKQQRDTCVTLPEPANPRTLWWCNKSATAAVTKKEGDTNGMVETMS